MGSSVSNAKYNTSSRMVTYKVNADNELRFAPLTAFYLGEAVLLVCWVSTDLRGVSVTLLLLHGVARRGRLLVHLLLMRWGIRVPTAGVDGRRHRGVGSALVRIRSA